MPILVLRGAQISLARRKSSGVVNLVDERSSARNKSAGGIVMPSALAAFRFTASSNLDGCSIGRSAGFAAAQNFVNEADDMIAAKFPAPSKEVLDKPAFPWGVQVIGDLSEVNALAAYRALQKKHEAILGSYQPRVIRTTTVKMNAAPIWTRIRI